VIEYNYRVFETEVRSIPALNQLLEALTKAGWEPINVDYVRYTVFAKKPTTLND
jgi:hypothetical protein